MMRKRALGGLLLVLAAALSAADRPARTLGLEAYPGVRDLYRVAEDFRVKHKLPALGVGVWHRGRIVALGMAGERASGSADWARIEDAFDVASCAKAVTATVAARLVEQGRVRWETTLGEAFPELRGTMHESYAAVTLEQLLRHRSGLDSVMNRNDRWAEWHRRHRGKSAAAQRLAFTASALQRPPRARPGTETFYCNDGFIVAGCLLERSAGVDWESLVRREVWVPLGLASARFGAPATADRAGVVAGHEDGWLGTTRVVRPAIEEFGAPPFGSPAGFLACSVPDLLRFVGLHLEGETTGAPLLRTETFRKLHGIEGERGFALGWEVEVSRDAEGRVRERSIYHGGYSGRSRANMWFVPETGWGTVIVLNHGRGDGEIATDVFYGLLREFGRLAAER